VCGWKRQHLHLSRFFSVFSFKQRLAMVWWQRNNAKRCVFALCITPLGVERVCSERGGEKECGGEAEKEERFEEEEEEDAYCSQMCEVFGYPI